MTHSMSAYLSDKIPEAVFHGQAVKTVAYLRVSTAQQDVHSQRLAILEYARKHDFRIDDFIEATASGQASEKRRSARRTDVRPPARRPFGRQRTLPARSVAGSDRRHPRRPRQGRHRLRGDEGEHPRRGQARHPDQSHDHTVFALFAEVERDLISERTREGLAKARCHKFRSNEVRLWLTIIAYNLETYGDG